MKHLQRHIARSLLVVLLLGAGVFAPSAAAHCSGRPVGNPAARTFRQQLDRLLLSLGVLPTGEEVALRDAIEMGPGGEVVSGVDERFVDAQVAAALAAGHQADMWAKGGSVQSGGVAIGLDVSTASDISDTLQGSGRVDFFGVNATAVVGPERPAGAEPEAGAFVLLGRDGTITFAADAGLSAGGGPSVYYGVSFSVEDMVGNLEFSDPTNPGGPKRTVTDLADFIDWAAAMVGSPQGYGGGYVSQALADALAQAGWQALYDITDKSWPELKRLQNTVGDMLESVMDAWNEVGHGNQKPYSPTLGDFM